MPLARLLFEPVVLRPNLTVPRLAQPAQKFRHPPDPTAPLFVLPQSDVDALVRKPSALSGPHFQNPLAAFEPRSGLVVPKRYGPVPPLRQLDDFPQRPRTAPPVPPRSGPVYLPDAECPAKLAERQHLQTGSYTGKQSTG